MRGRSALGDRDEIGVQLLGERPALHDFVAQVHRHAELIGVQVAVLQGNNRPFVEGGEGL